MNLRNKLEEQVHISYLLVDSARVAGPDATDTHAEATFVLVNGVNPHNRHMSSKDMLNTQQIRRWALSAGGWSQMCALADAC